MDEAHKVQVYVYDISHGMARMYARSLLGIDLEGIYHTSVVVYTGEHFIDGGILVGQPGKTRFGIPIRVIDMGETFIPSEVFQEYLDELKVEFKYSAEGYDLFDNNCNHFTDKVVDFLVGKNLDDSILGLPQRVLNTPNGQLLRQMLGGGQIV